MTLGTAWTKVVAGQQVVEVALVRLGQPVLVVDEEDDLLGEGPQLGDGARRVGVGVLLGEGAEVGQLLPCRVAETRSSVDCIHAPRRWAERSRFLGAAWPNPSASVLRVFLTAASSIATAVPMSFPHHLSGTSTFSRSSCAAKVW